MQRRSLARVGVVAVAGVLVGGCTSAAEKSQTPELEARGTVLTTVKPARQDLTNQISLSGKVEIDPVFGIVAPVGGEIRYLNKQPSKTPATRPMWVASVWNDGVPRRVEIPKDSTFAGRLMEDRADVTAGMPVVSAKHSGYGIVAEIDSAQAYRVSGSVQTVRGQIKNGPGPFPCTALGTIAALPAGTIPEPPPPSADPTPQLSGAVPPQAVVKDPSLGGGSSDSSGSSGSDATGMRLVCTPPEEIKLINGAAVTLDVVTAKASHVLVLPVEAVAGVQGHGKVDVVGPDRTRKTVDVTLGITDGKVVEIRKGLRGDETIAVPGPDLPTAAPNPDQGGSGAPG
ncbi:efflux RND transporter periplasmic adaptor subunit [Paractinoplanes globisporus]|uniref:Efflux RND transporter periplasmic adaptor subunit n=1 Tax=Paractinoplanes globisporus TaxID=113565 RepID=A0ABW6WFQ8_9ACTN|nr:efflux RND transporter periplasmic adaptor subunit [Actinoplanes globisporus]